MGCMQDEGPIRGLLGQSSDLPTGTVEEPIVYNFLVPESPAL